MNVQKFREDEGRDREREYAVEFSCVSTFLVGFKDVGDLTEKQIIQKAILIANSSFDKGGSLALERSNSEGFYTFTALGIDRSTGQVLGEKVRKKPVLKIIK